MMRIIFQIKFNWIEKLLEVTIQVYSLAEHANDKICDKDDDDGGTTSSGDTSRSQIILTAELIRRSICRYKDMMNVNLFATYFSYIADLKKYC